MSGFLGLRQDGASERGERIVAESPARNGPVAQDHPVVGAVAPPKPPVPAGTLSLVPYVIQLKGQRHSIGWQYGATGDPCFVVVRVRAIGNKILGSFPLTEAGWAEAWAALAHIDEGAAVAVAAEVRDRLAASDAHSAEAHRQTEVFKVFASAGGRTTVFSRLNVQVLADGNDVYTVGDHNFQTKTNTSRLLGPLAGAQAMVTDGSQAWSPGRAMFLPVALTGLATKAKADAAVVFPDGTVHTAPLDGNYALREAQKQVVQFNALATAAAPVATEASQDPAARLRKLQELRESGLLTEDEYETKRTEIINAI